MSLRHSLVALRSIGFIVLSMGLSVVCLAEPTDSTGLNPGGSSELACYRTDTLKVMRVTSLNDVRSFLNLAYDLEFVGITASEEDFARVAVVADSLRAYDYHNVLLIKILVLQYENSSINPVFNGDSICLILSQLIHEIEIERKSGTFNAIANYKKYKHKYAEAIVNYQMAYETAVPDAIVDRFHVIGNLASTYEEIGDTISAISLIRESLQLAPSLPQDNIFTFEYSNTYDYIWLSSLYRGKGLLDSAMYFCRMSEMNHFRIKGHPRFEETRSTVLYERASVLVASGQFEAAQATIDTLFGIDRIQAHYVQIDLYEGKGLYQLALASALAVAEEVGDDSPFIYRKLIKLSHAANQNAQALMFSQRLNDLLEHRLLETNLGLVEVSEAQRGSFIKQQQSERERHQQELAVLVERQRLLVSMAMLLLCILGAGYAWSRYLRTRKRSENLSLMVSERDRDLLAANKELSDRIAAMEEFNQLLSHDLREPIRSISGFTTLLKRRLVDESKVHAELNHLEASVDQLKHLISGIESLRKIQEFAKNSCVQTVDNICSEVAATVLGVYPKVMIHFQVDRNVNHVILSSKIASIALTELLFNAALFSPDHADDPEVHVTATDSMCIFTVTDYGIGIAAEYHNKVFKSFERLNRREQYPGAGIGLTVAKKAAELAGGSLRIVRSEVGVGSTFELRIGISNVSSKNKTAKYEEVVV